MTNSSPLLLCLLEKFDACQNATRVDIFAVFTLLLPHFAKRYNYIYKLFKLWKMAKNFHHSFLSLSLLPALCCKWNNATRLLWDARSQSIIQLFHLYFYLCFRNFLSHHLVLRLFALKSDLLLRSSESRKSLEQLSREVVCMLLENRMFVHENVVKSFNGRKFKYLNLGTFRIQLQTCFAWDIC